MAICAGNSPGTGEFPAQRPVTRSFDVFFDLRLNKRLSKQSWGWWFETLWRPLWRHCNVYGWIITILHWCNQCVSANILGHFVSFALKGCPQRSWLWFLNSFGIYACVIYLVPSKLTCEMWDSVMIQYHRWRWCLRMTVLSASLEILWGEYRWIPLTMCQ